MNPEESMHGGSSGGAVGSAARGNSAAPMVKTSTSAAPGLEQGRAVGIEGQPTRRELLTDDDLLSPGFRADVEAVVSPIAFFAAFALVALNVRKLFKKAPATASVPQTTVPSSAVPSTGQGAPP